MVGHVKGSTEGFGQSPSRRGILVGRPGREANAVAGPGQHERAVVTPSQLDNRSPGRARRPNWSSARVGSKASGRSSTNGVSRPFGTPRLRRGRPEHGRYRPAPLPSPPKGTRRFWLNDAVFTGGAGTGLARPRSGSCPPSRQTATTKPPRTMPHDPAPSGLAAAWHCSAAPSVPRRRGDQGGGRRWPTIGPDPLLPPPGQTIPVWGRRPAARWLRSRRRPSRQGDGDEGS